MKNLKRIFLIIGATLIITLAFPFTASAAPNEDGRTIFGESYTLETGRILDGDLNVFGGVVVIEEDATIRGDVLILGGLFTIDGTIEGNLTAIGGTINLESNAVIEGDLISPSSYINRDPGAVIQGEQRESWTGLELPFFFSPGIVRTPRMRILPILNRIIKEIGITLVLVALGALLLLLMPKSIETMTQALIIKPWQIFGYGALTALVMFFGGLLLTITICLIPVVILVGMAFGLAVLVGWLTLGYFLGTRIASGIFKTTWHPVLAAALGNLVLYLIAISVRLIPCLGGFLVFITMLFGLGMAVVTLFGTNPYPRNESINSEDQVVLFAEDNPENADVFLVKNSTKEVFEEKSGEQPAIAHLDRPIEALELEPQIERVLIEARLKTVGDVLNRLETGDQALLGIDGFSPKSLKDLKEALMQKGYEIPGATE